MFQIELKIESVFLRIKDPVKLVIIVVKNKWHFRVKQTPILINGQSHFDPNSIQKFFIAQKDPNFKINVLIVSNKKQKLAGNVFINLKLYKLQQQNHIQSKLQSSPDPKSIIKLSFKFKKSQQAYQQNRDLITSQQINQQLKNQQLRNTSGTNQQLKKLIKQKHGQIQQLKDQKQKIQKNYNQLKSTHQQSTKEFQRKILWKDQQINTLKDDLQKQRVKFAGLVDMINQYGDPELMQQMEQVMNQSLKF